MGAILYFVLTSRRPQYRTGPSGPLSATISKAVAVAKERLTQAKFKRMLGVLRRVLIPPHDLDGGHVDGALSAICVKALAPMRDDRYQTCRALHDDLQRFLVGCRDRSARARRRASDVPDPADPLPP